MASIQPRREHSVACGEDEGDEGDATDPPAPLPTLQPPPSPTLLTTSPKVRLVRAIPA